jgi:hypothetical protein
MFCTALLVLAAASSSGEGRQVNDVWLRDLSAGQRLEIQTTQRYYRAQLVNPATGEALASVSRDGVHYGQPARVYLLGWTKGRYPELLVGMGQIRVGACIELGLGTLAEADRALSEPVQVIRIFAEDASAAATQR